MCLVEDCSRESYCRQLCNLHYNRWRKWGTTDYLGRKPTVGRSVCSVEGCEKPVHTEMLCNTHLRRFRLFGDPLIIGRQRYNGTECGVVDVEGNTCQRIKYSNAYCKKHYRAFRLYGDPLAYKKAPPSSKTYVPVTAHGHPNANPEGKILQHRLVMSEFLGRPLVPGENVHHKNGNRKDNRLENLELWNTQQPAGQRVEDKVNWALEILSLYAPEKLKES